MTDNSDGTKRAFLITPAVGDPFSVLVKGRQAWMLKQLLQAGEEGFTSKDAPGARVSQYVRMLRLIGVPIVTFRVPHGGQFPGTHGVYVLDCQVRRIDPDKGGKGDDI